MLNLYHRRCGALAVCILILLSILSELPSNELPRWQGTHADAKFTSSTAGVEETQSISGPTIQDFYVNTTQCSASVQWNFTISSPTNGLQNVTFWWNNGSTDMGNTTITYTGSPNSANALFNSTLPSTAQNVTFQCWAYNVYNCSTTGVRWMLVYPSNSSNPYFLNLGTAISTIENANNWTATASDPNELYMGVVLQQNTTAQLQTMIDGFVTTQDWADVLKWSAICNKLSFTQQNDICYALGNYTMIGSLPYTQSSPNPLFCTESEWALYGYYYANTTWYKAYSGYNASQWNVTAAYQQFNASIYDNGKPLLYMWVGGGYSQNRYYDEDADTIECYILFANMLNVSGAMNDALYWWNYLVNTHWTGSYFEYTPTQSLYECEASFFLEIISILKYYNVALANWNDVIIDIGNRFLSSEWTSAQWWYNVVCHASAGYGIFGNRQRRLQNTLGAWQALLGVYLQLNTTYENNLKDMLLGNVNTQQAWNLLLQSGLYSSSTYAFYMLSTHSSTDPEATAYAEVLMWMMGIVPQNTTIAFPLEELNYEYVQEIDPALFKMNSTLKQVTIPVNQPGTITFQYGCSPITCYFSQAGTWQITFTNSWNNILNASWTGNLPDNVIYFQNIASTPTHDVAVVDVTSSKTVIGQGYSVNIDVTVTNQGDFTETSNVTVYANTTSIASQNVTLSSGNSATITFTWNTTGFAEGNYTISVYVSPAPGEADTADNTYVGGKVEVLAIPAGGVGGSACPFFRFCT